MLMYCINLKNMLTGKSRWLVTHLLSRGMLKNYSSTIKEYLNMVGLDFNIKIVVADNQKLMDDIKN